MLIVSHTTFFWKQIGYKSRILEWATGCRITIVLIITWVIFFNSNKLECLNPNKGCPLKGKCPEAKAQFNDK